MYIPNNLIFVTEQHFYEFLKDKEYCIKQGMYMHSEEYICKNTNEVIGYMESSSYHMNVTYMIKTDIYPENHKTILFVGDIIKNKLL